MIHSRNELRQLLDGFDDDLSSSRTLIRTTACLMSLSYWDKCQFNLHFPMTDEIRFQIRHHYHMMKIEYQRVVDLRIYDDLPSGAFSEAKNLLNVLRMDFLSGGSSV